MIHAAIRERVRSLGLSESQVCPSMPRSVIRRVLGGHNATSSYAETMLLRLRLQPVPRTITIRHTVGESHVDTDSQVCSVRQAVVSMMHESGKAESAFAKQIAGGFEGPYPSVYKYLRQDRKGVYLSTLDYILEALDLKIVPAEYSVPIGVWQW